jgi:hypothetical protein
MELLNSKVILRSLSLLIICMWAYHLYNLFEFKNDTVQDDPSYTLEKPSLLSLDKRDTSSLDSAAQPMFPKAKIKIAKKIKRSRGPIKVSSKKPWKLLGTINQKAATIQINPGQVKVWRKGTELEDCTLTQVLARSIVYKCGGQSFEL